MRNLDQLSQLRWFHVHSAYVSNKAVDRIVRNNPNLLLADVDRRLPNDAGPKSDVYQIDRMPSQIP